MLATLRKAAARPPGDVPEIWEITSDPESDGKTFKSPTWRENAIHVALTMYALHQQGNSSPMHIEGVGLGQAARRLVVGDGDEEQTSLRKRYNALVTASTFSSFTYHLRSFISLLRREGIALDYGKLAADLENFQRPGGSASLRLQWSRQFYGSLRTGEHDANLSPSTSQSIKN